MKRKVVSVLLSCVMVMAMTACGGTAPADTAQTDTQEAAQADAPAEGEAEAEAEAPAEGEAEATGEAVSVDVILKTLSSEYWGYVKAGADAYAKDHPNVTVDVKGPPSETSFEEQQNMIETDLGSGAYDAFVIAPLQSDVVANLIANEEKPVLAVDTNIDSPKILSFIGTGNEDAAKLGGEAAVAAAKEAGWEEIKCIEISGVQGDATNTARLNGYKAGVNGAGGEFLEDEVQYANGVADQAVTAMEAIMQNHPEGIAIICANNDDMAMAAARTAKGNAAYEKTIFLGFDGIQSACEAILAGDETMSVAQEAYEMGYKAVEAAVAAINGEELEAFIDSGCSVVDGSNAQERLDQLKGYLE